MGAVAIVFIGALLITELHFVNTVPVPELSVKLLCELLCEHCNGVANMESGHCNCEVPEAQFKDNSPCLERAQISAAEMNLKLTHFKNTRRERSVSDVLGRIKSDALEDAQINYSEGYNKLSHESLTPPTPNPIYMDKSRDQTPEHNELFVKRSINNVPAQELKHVDGYQEQSSEHKSLRKRSINNYFQTAFRSYLRSAQLPVFYPRRKKRSFTKRVEFTRNEDGTISHREITKPNENNYDVIVNVQTGIEIPALKAKEVDNENLMKSKFQENDDLQSQVSTSLVPDNSTIMKSEPSNPKQNSFGKMLGNIQPIISMTTSTTDGTPDAVVSNKSRSVVEQQLINNGKSNARMSTDLIGNSNPLLLDQTSGLQSLATLKLPKLLSRCKLRASNENKILQRSKIDDLKAKIEKLLLPREQPRIPFQSLLKTNELLKAPTSSIAMTENNPLARLVPFSSLPKSPTPLRISQNTALGNLLTKGTVNDLKLKGQGAGTTILEKIQLKLLQTILGGKSEQYRVQNRDASECQPENANSDLPLKLNPLVPLETKTHESTLDCEDEYNDEVASPMDSIDKSRSNSKKTESVRDEITTDTPIILPTIQESRSRTVIPTASSGNPFERTALANEPIDHVGKIASVKEMKHEGNENEPITKINQSISEPPKKENGSIVSPTQIEVADINMEANTSDSKSEHNDGDSNDIQYPDKLKGPFVASNVEAVPTDVSSTAPVVGLEPHVMQSDEPSQSKNGNIIDAKETLSNPPHFVNYQEKNAFTNTLNSFSPVFMSPAPGNNIRLSPEETYHGMFNPPSVHNGMQQIFYPPLLVRSDLANDGQESVLNIPVVVVPNSITVPFDHQNRLTGNFNGASYHPNLPHPNEQSGMIMRAFVPAELNTDDQTNLPPSSMFLVEPLLTPDGNIPYSEVLNQLRTGHAIIQIQPINLRNPENSRT